MEMCSSSPAPEVCADHEPEAGQSEEGDPDQDLLPITQVGLRKHSQGGNATDDESQDGATRRRCSDLPSDGLLCLGGNHGSHLANDRRADPLLMHTDRRWPSAAGRMAWFGQIVRDCSTGTPDPVDENDASHEARQLARRVGPQVCDEGDVPDFRIRPVVRQPCELRSSAFTEFPCIVVLRSRPGPPPPAPRP